MDLNLQRKNIFIPVGKNSELLAGEEWMAGTAHVLVIIKISVKVRIYTSSWMEIGGYDVTYCYHVVMIHLK